MYKEQKIVIRMQVAYYWKYIRKKMFRFACVVTISPSIGCTNNKITNNKHEESYIAPCISLQFDVATNVNWISAQNLKKKVEIFTNKNHTLKITRPRKSRGWKIDNTRYEHGDCEGCYVNIGHTENIYNLYQKDNKVIKLNKHDKKGD